MCCSTWCSDTPVATNATGRSNFAAMDAVTDADVIVVGGGHNGLICAAYLARAGIDTLLLEARDEVGGCASTVSDLGARFNICNCDHTLIRAMPVIDELELAGFGLHYLEASPSGINLFYDDSEPWIFLHDRDEMVDALATSHPHQVDGYRRYLEDAIPVAKLVIEMARTHPSTSRMVARAVSQRAVGAKRLLEWSKRSVDDVFADYFDDWHLTMPAISTGPTVWGLPPSTPGTGLAALAYATRHLVRTGRPQGGSGALTDATRASFEAAGGQVQTGARVQKLVIRDGRVVGVRLDDESEIEATKVVAACDPQRVLVDWVDDPPITARRLLDKWRAMPIHDGYESKIDAVLDTLPRYRTADRLEARFPGLDTLGPTTIISPSPDALADAHAGRAEGRVAVEPTMLVNVPSVLDPAMMTPEGKHILSLEVLFTPYALQGGWPESGEPQRWFGRWAEFVEPGILDAVTAWRAMTPDRYEAEFSMHRGHTPSYGGSPLAALFGTQRELTRYRSPINGLYLSGAGTFPGAGVFGAPGRNTARVVIGDLTETMTNRLRTVSRQASQLRPRRPR